MLNINNIVNVSITDVLELNNGGISLLLSLLILDEPYEILYWFNKEGDVRLVPEQNFLDKLQIESVYDYEYINDLIYFIHTNIPNMDKIINKYF